MPQCLRASKRRRAFTLIELLLALIITASVSAVIAILMNGTAVGTNNEQDGRRSLVKMQAIKARFGDQLMSAAAILAVGSNYIVYWTGDQAAAATPINGSVNLSEIHLLELIPSSGQLSLYAITWPTSYTNSQIVAADTTYPPSTDWYAAAQAAKSNALFAPTLVASGLSTMASSLDASSATAAKMISTQISFNDGYSIRTLVTSAALANHVVPQ